MNVTGAARLRESPVEGDTVEGAKPLRIVHVVRAPIGGIFRHILDLAGAQTAAGHAGGIICDSTSGGKWEDDLIAAVAPKLALGATRFPMRRSVSLTDLS